MIANKARKTKDPVKRRRGVVAVQVALAGTVIFGLTALTIDVGYLYMANAEMQRAADASALAGASALMLGSAPVHQRAIDVAARNPVIRSPVTPGELNVVIGNWEARTLSFTPLGEGDTILPNAVRAAGSRPDVPLFFARVLGFNESDVQKEAIALFGSGRCAGVWGLEGITGNGSIVTDSYDSSEGPYGSGNIHPNGDICSCQDIDVFGSVEIHGDAMYGEGYGFYPSGNAWEVWGVVAAHGCNVPPFEADFAAAAVDNDNATIGTTVPRGHDPFRGHPYNLRIGGLDNLTLAGGTYYFTSVLLTGQGTLNITGPTTIYVTGPADFRGGGIFNSSEEPSDLVIYCSDPTVMLKGTSGFYGAVIAPFSDVKLVGTSDFYGTLLGRTLDANGDTAIHVDETIVAELFGVEPAAPVIVK